MWNQVMPIGSKPFRGSAIKFDKTDTSPARAVFYSGVERLGIYFDGRVWADSDLQRVELDQTKVQEYLTSIGISHL